MLNLLIVSLRILILINLPFSYVLDSFSGSDSSAETDCFLFRALKIKKPIIYYFRNNPKDNFEKKLPFFFDFCSSNFNDSNLANTDSSERSVS